MSENGGSSVSREIASGSRPRRIWITTHVGRRTCLARTEAPGWHDRRATRQIGRSAARSAVATWLPLVAGVVGSKGRFEKAGWEIFLRLNQPDFGMDASGSIWSPKCWKHWSLSNQLSARGQTNSIKVLYVNQKLVKELYSCLKNIELTVWDFSASCDSNSTWLESIDSCTQVYLLMHTSEVNIRSWQKTSKDSDRSMTFKDEIMGDKECYEIKQNLIEKEMLDSAQSVGAPVKAYAGAIWDVFRRQDVPKLNDYLRAHQKEFTSASSSPVTSVVRPVYDQAVYFNKDKKRQLKEEFGIEPWTFEQHVGEAVFIPAGCPFQVRNLQSSVQLGLEFLFPESLHESVRLAREIRCLPNDHDAKLKMMEVGKISLYAASWAIKEIQKIILDPKLSSGIRFEDRNLTAMVSQNLEKMTKRRPIICT